MNKPIIAIIVGACALLWHSASQAASDAPARVWTLRLGVAEDIAFIGGEDVCTGASQLNDGFSCFRSSGSQYHGTPLPGQRDKINSGLALAATRALVGADWVLAPWLGVGAEAGLVLFGAGPTPDGGKAFLPVHAAGRVLLFPTQRATDREGLVPYVLISGGVRQVDAKQSVSVVEDPNAPPPPNQPDNPPIQDLDAYKKMGSGFAGLGGGARLGLGSGFDIAGELSLLQLFPSSGTTLSLAMGLQYAL